jgi:acetyl-CoA synthetase
MANRADAFLQARDFLLKHRDHQIEAVRDFRWPRLELFNWALDYFDPLALGNNHTALWITDDEGVERRYSYAELSERSNRVANALRALGAKRGERLLLMVPNVAPMWETMLAAMKLGVVIVPTTTQLATSDLADRMARGAIRHVVADGDGAARFADINGSYTRLIVGAARSGWIPFERSYEAPATFAPDTDTHATDPLLLYFTSGTTSRPKLVAHTHASYPVGHLSTLYWIGLRAGDIHCNISSPGWAKHAWSSVFAPWNAGATSLAYHYARFDAKRTLDMLLRCRVTTLCAPPTVWRMLVGEDLARWPVVLREAVSAGEPLNPEVIERVQRAWGITCATATARPRPPLRSAMRRDNRSSPVRWDDPCRLRHRAARCAGRRVRRGRDLDCARAASARPHAGYLGDRRTHARGDARRLLPHGRRREPRRGRLHHLRRPRGRRVQELGLSHQSLRARERAR